MVVSSTLRPADGGIGKSRRFYDPKLQATIVQVFQGEYHVTGRPGEILSTILGSCIAACIRDPVLRVGGMNHFLLPARAGTLQDMDQSFALRYGSFAMEELINAILKRGGRKERLEVKVFGGANVLSGMTGIGHKNADFVEQFLGREGVPIAAHDLRGHKARRVQYNPYTGKVRLREVQDKQKTAVFALEERKSPIVSRPASGGDVELFD
jgi:chemotaxis protein CheD